MATPMNQRVRNLREELLSDNWYTLKKYTYDYQRRDGTWHEQQREAYDRGNGACVLLYNLKKRSVILTRQFRLPAYLNGAADGMLVEVAAGLLDDASPAERVKLEAEEETGYRVDQVEPVFAPYMSPGAVTEKVHCFTARYDDTTLVSDGGGLAEEGEDIEVLEFVFDDALAMAYDGRIQDGKTVMLLLHAALHLFEPSQS